MSNPKVYNIVGNLVTDVKINLNKHNNFYAFARISGSKGETTVVTHAKKAIAALSQRRLGQSVSLYGAFCASGHGSLFSVRGVRAIKTEPAVA